MNQQLLEEDRAFIKQFSAEVDKNLQEYRHWRIFKWKQISIRIAICTVVVVVMNRFFHFKGGIYGPFWVLFSGGAIGAAAQSAKTARQKAAETVEKARDPRLVGVLAAYATGGDPVLRAPAIRALMKTLPQVGAAQEWLFTSEEQLALVRLLKERKGLEFLTRLLRVLKVVGDHHALPVVQKLVENPQEVLNVENSHQIHKEIQEYALHCLPEIEARAELSLQRSSLLRAAEHPDEDTTLLRPAGTTAEPQEQLLRPAE
jgi:hypothetical protein